MYRLSLHILLLCLICCANVVCAQDPSPQIEAQAKSIFSSVMSPFCPGRILNDCPSSSASELKAKIVTMLTEGKSEEEIKAYLYANYGEEVRAAPTLEKFGLVAWLAPPFFLLAGFFFVWAWLQSKKSSSRNDAQMQDEQQIEPEMQSRIEEELARG